MYPKLEVACFDLESAKTAADAGADRIEFADDYRSGGVTPSPEDFRELRAHTSTPVFILIRPRGGDFNYSNEEVFEMKRSITEFSELGANGFVFGCLTKDNEIDKHANSVLFATTQPLPCTFHRAFDRIEDPKPALKTIIDTGFSFILTSGGKNNAVEGAGRLAELKTEADGFLEIMPGGGIRSGNIIELRHQVKTNWYHSACITGSSERADKNEIIKIKNLLK